MMMWSPWATLSRGGIAVKATFVTLVFIAAMASIFLGKDGESTNESGIESLAERFVNQAYAPTQKKQDMAVPDRLRRLQENKRKERKRTTQDGQSMIPFSGTDEEDCTSRFCKKELSDACSVEFKVNIVVPPTITMTLACEGSGWVGIGFSDNGKMMYSDAVLGIPGTTPEKYRLGGYDKSTVTPMEKDRQTLVDASVTYDDAADVTVLKFTKIMKEDGEIEIKTGKSTFLYAKGILEALDYHQERDLFELTIPEVHAVLEMPADGEEESSERNDTSVEDSSAGKPSQDSKPPAATDGEEDTSDKKKKKDRDEEVDTSAKDSSAGNDVPEMPADGEEESSEKKKKKDRDEEDDTSVQDSSTETPSQESKPPAATDGEEETSEKKKKKDRDEEVDTSAKDSSEGKQSQESNKKQGDGTGKATLAEQVASLGPIQLRPVNVKALRPQLSPPSQPVDNFPYPYPNIRFTEWDYLSPKTKEIMKENFGYSKGNWNALGQNQNERMTCSQLTVTQRQAIQLLGWSCDVWDCFINHYKSYNEKQLEANDLVEHVDVVRSAWVKPWVDLTEEELQSANRLCFMQILWDVGYLGAN
jgi:hypothetical protein